MSCEPRTATGRKVVAIHGGLLIDDVLGIEAEAVQPFDPARVAHSFAVKYGLRAHLTYEQAMALERDLTTHLRVWLADPS